MELLTKEFILENSKKIAIFDGYQLQEDNVYRGINGNEDYTPIYINDGDTFLYHESYEWSMPVIDKIEMLGYSVYMFPNHSFAIYKGNTISSERITKIEGKGLTKKQTLFLLIIQFIDWYNSNK